MNLPRANAILAVHGYSHHGEPLLKADRGVLEDRSGFQAELSAGMPRVALPQARILGSDPHVGQVTSPSRQRRSTKY